jgi:hypothetical protein
MGSDADIVCPYCSTLFRYKASLGEGGAEPAECLYHERADKAPGDNLR